MLDHGTQFSVAKANGFVLPDGARVLDLGCGNGSGVAALLALGWSSRRFCVPAPASTRRSGVTCASESQGLIATGCTERVDFGSWNHPVACLSTTRRSMVCSARTCWNTCRTTRRRSARLRAS